MTEYKFGTWYPIASLKKEHRDDTNVLLWDEGRIVVGNWWSPYNDWGPRVACIKNPTYFMPLPPPPEEK